MGALIIKMSALTIRNLTVGLIYIALISLLLKQLVLLNTKQCVFKRYRYFEAIAMKINACGFFIKRG